MPKERPILFSGPMVRAILVGRKTQTRRIVKCDFTDPGAYVLGCYHGTWGIHRHVDQNEPGDVWRGQCPYGVPGDRLWVREAWAPAEPGPLREGMAIAYRDDYHDDPHGFNGEKSPQGKYRSFKPSIHMPRWASRINLLITGIRIERLHEISEADVLAESFESREAMQTLWNTIHGPDSWDANPFVWVVEFERCEQKPETA